MVNKFFFLRKVEKLCLIAQINGLSKTIKQFNKKILKEKDSFKKNVLCMEKKELESIQRNNLLAYALLTGKQYFQVENTCSIYNKPKAKDILETIKKFEKFYTTKYIQTFSIENIQRWLNKENVSFEELLHLERKNNLIKFKIKLHSNRIFY